MPHCGIHGQTSRNWNPAVPSAKPVASLMEMMKVAAEARKPMVLIAVVAERGNSASTTAATIGSQRMMLSRKLSIIWILLQRHSERSRGTWVGGGAQHVHRRPRPPRSLDYARDDEAHEITQMKTMTPRKSINA